MESKAYEYETVYAWDLGVLVGKLNEKYSLDWEPFGKVHAVQVEGNATYPFAFVCHVRRKVEVKCDKI